MTEGPRRAAETSPRRPRDAATLIIVDRRASGPHVLMGRRHAGHRFMPGKFVFPGGALDPADRRIEPATRLTAPVANKLNAGVRPSPTLARALALAAIRETFEETGLVIGEPQAAPTKRAAGVWGEFFARGYAPALDGLDLVARAVTPPGRTKRFDARFFVIDAARIRAEIPGVVHAEAELVELVWAPLDDTGALDLPLITRWVLDDLREALREGAAPDRRRPFYREVRGQDRKGWL